MADDKRIRIHYIKSSSFRVVHADGVVGGPTPAGLLQISFFSERAPIPTMVEHAVSDLGGGVMKLGAEVGRESKQGVVREVEVSTVMTGEMAKKLYAWLGQHIGRLDAASKFDGEEAGPDAS
jgi:hypothetical protein